MTDEEKPEGEKPADTPETPEAPETPPAPPEKPAELGDAGKAALDAERKSRRDAEKRAKAAEARAKELEDEKLSDAERTQAKADAEKARADSLESRVKRDEVRAAARKAGVSNPDIAAQLIDPSKVELDENGKATNADALVTDIVTEYPDLKPSEKDERPADVRQVLKDGKQVDGDEKPQLKSTEGLSPEEIVEAMNNGQLRDYLAKTK